MKGLLIGLGVASAVASVVMLLACGGCFMFVSSLPKPTAEQRVENAKQMDLAVLMRKAERETEYWVKEVLKAPTTAKFELHSQHKDGKVVLVKGKVTAQNSFGAMITTPVEAVFLVKGNLPSIALLVLDGKEKLRDEADLAKCNEALAQDKSKKPLDSR